MVYTVLIVSGFLSRVCAWSIRPIFGVYIVEYGFEFLGYWYPEIVPTIAQLLVIRRELIEFTKTKAMKGDLYDDDLNLDEDQFLVNESFDQNTIVYETVDEDGNIRRVTVPLASDSEIHSSRGSSKFI